PDTGCPSYEVESPENTTEGSAMVLSCRTCSGGEKVGYVGNNSGTLQFDHVSANAPGGQVVTIWYTNGDAVRYAFLSVNGGAGTPVSFPSTGSFQTVGSVQRTVTLNAGSNNTLKFYNPIVGSWAPDFNRIQEPHVELFGSCLFACSPKPAGGVGVNSWLPPREIPEIFQKSLDAISPFAAKGVSRDVCTA